MLIKLIIINHNLKALEIAAEIVQLIKDFRQFYKVVDLK